MEIPNEKRFFISLAVKDSVLHYAYTVLMQSVGLSGQIAWHAAYI